MTDIPLHLLHARFLRYETEGEQVYLPDESDMARAMGVIFLCPLCFERNGGSRGTHSVICWSKNRGTPDEASPGPGRWELQGTGIADLTLGGENGRSRSVALTGGCGWHGFVTAGQASTQA